jgi:hypothetical protein
MKAARSGQKEIAAHSPVQIRQGTREVSFAVRATKIRQILVPIDFSPESEETLRFAKLHAAIRPETSSQRTSMFDRCA